MTPRDPHDMPPPERLDALLDGETPRDDGERDALAFAAALREATPGAPDDLRRRAGALAAAAPAEPAPRRGRSWLPWGGGAVAAGAVAAAVAGIMMTGKGGDDQVALRTDVMVQTGAAEAAPSAGAPSADARAAAPGVAPTATVPVPAPVPKAPAAPSRTPTPAPAPAPAPGATFSGTVLSVGVPRGARTARLAAAFAATRTRGLVLANGTLSTGTGGATYAVSTVLAGGPPHALGRALRAAVARPASVAATGADRALAAAVISVAAAPSDRARRRVLARRERQAGATPPPIASGEPVTIVFRLPG